MNQVIKFPDMRPPKSRSTPMRGLPAPAQYRQSSPAIITADAGVTPKPLDRRRLYLWFGVAVALHAALLFGIWLAPPLRLKWEPSPDAWVQVVALPQKAPPPVSSPDAVTAQKATAPRVKSRKSQPSADSPKANSN